MVVGVRLASPGLESGHDYSVRSRLGQKSVACQLGRGKAEGVSADETPVVWNTTRI